MIQRKSELLKQISDSVPSRNPTSIITSKIASLGVNISLSQEAEAMEIARSQTKEADEATKELMDT